jgi:diaminohydroxyphosphoribosylaminopyrimidine deaminase/5-amino-6-(5-phosphoribosylamino)uracil reductase
VNAIGAVATNALDAQRMREALALAETSFGLTEPNPRVGCVIGLEDGQVLGCGATQQAGGAHAEVMALRDARASGRELRGATAWVTLEPCAHHGRTPPCCDALVEAGVSRVVVAAVDPYPQVAGAGIARLRAAGIRVDMADADVAEAARDINIGFFSRIERGRPWVRVKIAASLDGRTALDNGVSQWITGAEARQDGHAWRRRSGAVLTGIGTLLADDPRLDVRLVPSPGQPLRVVLDSQWNTPPDARILVPPGRVLIYGAQSPGERGAALQACGAEIHVLRDGAGQIDLDACLVDLARRGVNELHVEAGERLNAAFLQAGLVDELLVYLAPRLLGIGRGMATLGPYRQIDAGPVFRHVECRDIGADVRLRLRARTAQPEEDLDSRHPSV